MDNKAATTAEAAPAVIEATTHLVEVTNEPKDDIEKHKTDMSEKKTSDVLEILQGLVGRLEQMEEKMDSRFRQMEEKMDCRLQQIEGKVDLLITSIKAEADNMSVDGSYSDDEEPAKKKSEADTKTPKEEVPANLFKPFTFNNGVRSVFADSGRRDEEERSGTFFAEKESGSPFKLFNGGGRSVFADSGRRDEERSRTFFAQKESGSRLADTKTPKEEVPANLIQPFTFNNGGRSVFADSGRRDEEERSGTLFAKKESDSGFNPFGGDVPSLFVGGRFSGGRCGGQGVCSLC